MFEIVGENLGADGEQVINIDREDDEALLSFDDFAGKERVGFRLELF